MIGNENWDLYPYILRAIILESSRYGAVPRTLKEQLEEHLYRHPEDQQWVDEAEEIYL